VVREALVWLGQADPVLSQEKSYKEDPYRSAAREFLSLWKEHLGLESYKNQDILKVASETEEVDEHGHPITSEEQRRLARYQTAKRLKHPELFDLLMEQCGERGAISAKRFGFWLRSLRNQPYTLTRMEGEQEVSEGTYRITIAKQSDHGNWWKLEKVAEGEADAAPQADATAQSDAAPQSASPGKAAPAGAASFQDEGPL
jgi:hypothetical protein